MQSRLELYESMALHLNHTFLPVILAKLRIKEYSK